jgi:hypothetical protein
MATRSKFRKLSLGPSEPITRRNSAQGMLVVGDYIDPLTNQRTLLLERPDVADPKPAAPAKKRQRKPRSNSQLSPGSSPATAFPGGDVRTA